MISMIMLKTTGSFIMVPNPTKIMKKTCKTLNLMQEWMKMNSIVKVKSMIQKKIFRDLNLVRISL